MTENALPQTLQTLRFGVVTYGDDDVLHFEEGIPAFEEHRRWILLGGKDDTLKWLQSLDDASLALPVASPFDIDRAYSVEIPAEDADAVGLDRTRLDRTGLLVVVTIPRDAPWDATANMTAPLVVSADTRRGRQIVVADGRYSVWHPVLEPSLRQAMAEKGRA